MSEGRGSRAWALAGLAASLSLPSLGVAQKYAGIGGVAAYCVLVVVVLGVARAPLAALSARITDRHARWLTGVTLVALVGVFAAVHPLVDLQVSGRGSDRDDALDLATRALLRGEYPYRATTYLGNPISPLPGSLVFAAPFVLLGTSSLQSFFWLAVFAVTIERDLSGKGYAVVLLWISLALSPVVMNELVAGGDLLANGLFVTVLMLWAVRSHTSENARLWPQLFSALLLGVGLSSRASFLLLLPLAFAAVAHRAGWRPAIRLGAIATLSFSLVTLPFYFHDPSGFSPLHALNKLGIAASVAVASASTVLALGLAAARSNRDGRGLLRSSALVLAFPVVAAVVLHCLRAGRLELVLAGYALPVVFIGGAASSVGWTQRYPAA